jgi:hypothetical protein
MKPRVILSAAKDLLLLCAFLPTLAWAHPLAPGLLELTQTAPERYAVLWRTSVARAGSAAVEPRLPDQCRQLSRPEPRIERGEALVSRWLVQCAGGVTGTSLAVAGLEGSGINVIVRVVEPQATFKALLDAAQPAVRVDLAAEPVFRRYLALGAEHFAGGLDHLLFVLGLFLLVPSLRLLVATVTAFTVGHSITLSLAAFGYVPIGQAVAELAIAATVLVLALELARKNGSESFSSAKMTPTHFPVMAGVFGLVHGLGFAGALRDVGLPAGDIPLALLAFNLGIELAQLAFVGAALAATVVLSRLKPLEQLPRLQQLPAYVTGTLAACWLLERSVALLA